VAKLRRAGAPGAGTAKPGAGKLQTSYEMTIVANGAVAAVSRILASFGMKPPTRLSRHGRCGRARLRLDVAVCLGFASCVGPIRDGITYPREVVPPYATLKSLPSFSLEAAKRGRGGMIIVFGVINRQGKFEDLRSCIARIPASISSCWTPLKNGRSGPRRSTGRRCR